MEGNTMSTQSQPYRRGNATGAITAAVGSHGEPSVSLRSYIQPVDGIALASFNVVYSGQKNPVSTASAIEKLLDNDVTVIPGSLREVAEASRGAFSVVTARVTGKTKKLFVESADNIPEQFTCVSKNLFMDGEEKMWDLQANNGRTVLVRKENVEGSDELEQLLHRFAPVTAAAIKAADELVDQVHTLANSLDTGVLISYVQPQNRQVKLGFCLSADGNEVEVVPELGAVERIPLSLVTAGFSSDQYLNQIRLPNAAAVASDNIASRDALVSYYRKIYGMNEGFFSSWTKQLQSMSL